MSRGPRVGSRRDARDGYAGSPGEGRPAGPLRPSVGTRPALALARPGAARPFPLAQPPAASSRRRRRAKSPGGSRPLGGRGAFPLDFGSGAESIERCGARTMLPAKPPSSRSRRNEGSGVTPIPPGASAPVPRPPARTGPLSSVLLRDPPLVPVPGSRARPDGSGALGPLLPPRGRELPRRHPGTPSIPARGSARRPSDPLRAGTGGMPLPDRPLIAVG